MDTPEPAVLVDAGDVASDAVKDPSPPSSAPQEPADPVHHNGSLHASHADPQPPAADVELPIAERLVEEAVDEAVEQVSRMAMKGGYSLAAERTDGHDDELEAAPGVVDTESPIPSATAVGDSTEGRTDLHGESTGAEEPVGEADVVGNSTEDRRDLHGEATGVEEPADVVETLEKPPEEEEKDKKEEYVDILGNGCLRKKTLAPGKGRETRPLHGDTVTVSYTARLTDAEEAVVVEPEEVTFVVGDGDVMQAMDLAIALTELQEEFELITDPKFAYGPLGLEPNIPPNASLTISAKLLRIDEPPVYDSMPWSRLVAFANQKRERGNFLFGRNEFALSINSYNKALEILNSRRPSDVGVPGRPAAEIRRRADGDDVDDVSDGEDQDDERYERWKEDVLDTKVKIYNNMAAAQIRVDAFEAAVNSCDEVLKLSPDNVKAWFRRGKAKAGKGEYNEAVRSLRSALKYDPESRIVQSELKRVLASVKAERETQQRIYRRMFGAGPGEVAGGLPGSGAGTGLRSWRRYLWYGAAVTAVGISVALASAAYKYHQQRT